MNSRLVVVAEDELAALVQKAVKAALDEHERPVVEPAPALLDREQLAHALRVSAKTVDRLRLKPSFPELRLGDSPRFEIDAVLAWLKVSGTPLRLVKGGG